MGLGKVPGDSLVQDMRFRLHTYAAAYNLVLIFLTGLFFVVVSGKF